MPQLNGCREGRGKARRVAGRAGFYFVMAMVFRFGYLEYALALVFIGGKIFLAGIIGKSPAWISLAVTLGRLLGGVLVSLAKTSR
ncbi:hypothetical protein GCM10027514_20680 [Azotobacter armeniacus]